MKRNFHTAFPTLSTYAAAASQVYQAFKRVRSGYSIFGNPNEENMARTRLRLKFRRGGSRTIQRRRKRFRRSGPAKKVRRIWRFMRSKGLRNIETKYTQNYGQTNTTITSSGIYNLAEGTVAPNYWQYRHKILFSAINQGTGRSFRVGNKVFLKTLKFRGMVTHPLAANSTDEIFVCIIIVRVKQAMAINSSASTADPILSQVYENIVLAGGPPNTPNTITDSRIQFLSALWNFYNSKVRNDYQVLYKRVVKVSNETGSGMEKRMLKANIRINKPCFWDDNDNQGDGHIYLFAFSDTTNKTAATAAGDLPNLFYSYRLTYTDV